MNGQNSRFGLRGQRLAGAGHIARLGQPIDDHGVERRAEPFPLAGLPTLDQTEVEERDAAVVVELVVARVRVAVEKAVNHYLFESGAQKVLGQRLPVETGRFNGGNIGNFEAVHKFHGQHASGAQIVVKNRYSHAGDSGQILVEAEGIIGFNLVVQFKEDLAAKFVNHTDQVDITRPAKSACRQASQLTKRKTERKVAEAVKVQLESSRSSSCPHDPITPELSTEWKVSRRAVPRNPVPMKRKVPRFLL